MFKIMAMCVAIAGGVTYGVYNHTNHCGGGCPLAAIEACCQQNEECCDTGSACCASKTSAASAQKAACCDSPCPQCATACEECCPACPTVCGDCCGASTKTAAAAVAGAVANAVK